jgi:glycine/D-amino acid oxidase-like deaminating enzyme
VNYPREKVAAKHTVVAAGAFSANFRVGERAGSPCKGQMVSLRSATAKIERVLWSERIVGPETTVGFWPEQL